MSDAIEIPEFLRRIKPGVPTMTTAASPVAPAAPAKPKTRRKDAYIARVTISIPLDMTDADSLAGAIKAVAAIEATLPAGASFKSEGSLGKI